MNILFEPKDADDKGLGLLDPNLKSSKLTRDKTMLLRLDLDYALIYDLSSTRYLFVISLMFRSHILMNSSSVIFLLSTFMCPGEMRLSPGIYDCLIGDYYFKPVVFNTFPSLILMSCSLMLRDDIRFEGLYSEALISDCLY